MRDHRKLRAFELADNLVIAIYKATKDYPKEELFGLTSQLRRAAVSIASNIVEGSARSTKTDYVRFLDIAFASLREVEYQLTIAKRLGYSDEETSMSLERLTDEALRVMSGLIRSLRSE